MTMPCPSAPESPDLQATETAGAEDLAVRLGEFIRAPRLGQSAEDFSRLAADVFAFQFEHVEPFRRLCASRGVSPESLSSWREVPTVPVAAFKAMALHAAPAREVFRSSGTTQGARRSVHHHPFPQLYRHAIDSGFVRRCLYPGEERLPILSLVAPRHQVPDSSLSFMADHLITHFGAEPSAFALGADGLDVDAAERWVDALEGPGFIVSTAFALAWWLDELERRGRRLALPPGSRIFETGGFKGRARELRRPELLAALGERFGVSPSQVIREYGMSELTGHFYTAVLDGGDPDLFQVPHFMRARALDPATLEAVGDGDAGLLAFLDLANAGSAMAVLSEDLGRLEGDGFRLLGRAQGAELRGCSLTIEELRA